MPQDSLLLLLQQIVVKDLSDSTNLECPVLDSRIENLRPFFNYPGIL